MELAQSSGTRAVGSTCLQEPMWEPRSGLLSLVLNLSDALHVVGLKKTKKTKQDYLLQLLTNAIV